ncbi:MAG: hypothetical protein ACI945_000538 [Pseudohongiellaceae bacterium]|jgi:hypothetical protein
MFIKFESNGSAPFVMPSGIAQQLVSMMGQGKEIEGSISGPTILDAISKLERALVQQSTAEEPQLLNKKGEESRDDDEAEQPLRTSARAVPLMEMLQAAKQADSFVMWRPE